MPFRFLAALPAFGVAIFAALLAGPANAACRPEQSGGARYTVCSFDPKSADLRIYSSGPDGQPFATFPALSAALQAEGVRLAFAMNGGMYDEDLRPVGLLVEKGRELHPANTKSVARKPEPNFFKKPNGVFYLAAGEAGVLATEAYLSSRPAARYATQSGPMLLIDGAVHPAFIPGSTDRKPRNGVGVDRAGAVHFVITEGAVNFHDFALFFRDRLRCDDALFLDGGTAPGLYAPELGRSDRPGHGGYGPIIAVVE